MRWPHRDEQPVVKTVILSNATVANEEAIHRTQASEATVSLGVGCGGLTDHDLMAAGWELRKYAGRETTGEHSAATSEPD